MTERKCPDCGRVKGLRVMTAKMFKAWMGPVAGKDWTPTRVKHDRDRVTFMRCPCTSVFKVYGAAAGGGR